MNPQIKQTGLRKSLHTRLSRRHVLLTQPAVCASFKPWGSYSKKRKGTPVHPTHSGMPAENTRRKWTHDTLPDKQETILCLGKKLLHDQLQQKKNLQPLTTQCYSWGTPQHEELGIAVTKDSGSLAWPLTMAWPPETTQDCRWNWVQPVLGNLQNML